MNDTMTETETPEKSAFGIVIAQGSVQSSMRPIVAFTEGDGYVSLADVGSPVWDEMVGDEPRWQKEAHQAEYITETADSLADALAEIEEAEMFRHVYAIEAEAAKEKWKRHADIMAKDEE